MKCLLCRQNFDYVEHLNCHYIEEHRVSTSNNFFQKLFEESGSVATTGSSFKPKKCFRCDKLIPNKKYKKIHNLLCIIAREDITLSKKNPLDYKNIDDEIIIYEISYEKHREYYDFCHSNKTINDFLTNVENKYQVFDDVIIKVGFSIKNFQPVLLPVDGNLHALTNVRYWSTET